MYSVHIRSIGCAGTSALSPTIGTGLGKLDIEVYVYESLDTNISLYENLTFFLLYFVNNNMP